MADIILATANARFSHTSIALRYLKANLGPLAERAEIMELTIDERAADIAEKILGANPKILGLSVYIWNVQLLNDVVAIIKNVRPEVVLVLGGPEVSFEIDEQEITRGADYVIAGEGEMAFARLASDLLGGHRPADKIVSETLSDLATLALPYDLYDDRDIDNRVVYVEASRGCPFGCEFCLASLDKKVRKFPEEPFLQALEDLWNRGARRFKFVDRALHLAVTQNLLDFFLARVDEGVFVHFELVPDRLPEKLFDILKQFPAGAVQLEAGLQTTAEDVAMRIGRRQDTEKALNAINRLRTETGVHLHTDLVVGLPGETLESFGHGFDRLISTRPHEIQVGILKLLRGAPIRRHDDEWGMVYSTRPPYEILQNRLIDFSAMQRLKRFSRYFDLVFNNGNFATSAQHLWGNRSPFEAFMNFADWLFAKTGRTSAIALNRLAELIFEYMTTVLGTGSAEAANRLFADYARVGRKGLPGTVGAHVTRRAQATTGEADGSLPPRQRRHAAIKTNS
ncbi:MAG: DUF4080 domain-containing protein [Deltaproteobacteria bacterium]|nr:DUF4080 domain-containing protein [Deltaproteobacteria bacterium]